MYIHALPNYRKLHSYFVFYQNLSCLFTCPYLPNTDLFLKDCSVPSHRYQIPYCRREGVFRTISREIFLHPRFQRGRNCSQSSSLSLMVDFFIPYDIFTIIIGQLNILCRFAKLSMIYEKVKMMLGVVKNINSKAFQAARVVAPAVCFFSSGFLSVGRSHHFALSSAPPCSPSFTSTQKVRPSSPLLLSRGGGSARPFPFRGAGSRKGLRLRRCRGAGARLFPFPSRFPPAVSSIC